MEMLDWTWPSAPDLIAFASVCLMLVCLPGPNMAYLLSRATSQGPGAALVSLAGVGVGFLIYLGATVLGVAALVMAHPVAFEVLRWAGAAYLVVLAVRALQAPRGRGLELQALPRDGPYRLFLMGLATNMLNPKAAMLYLSLLPQFIRPDLGGTLSQGLVLGFTQIGISLSVNGLLIATAAMGARVIRTSGRFVRLQAWITASVFGALAARMMAMPKG